MGHGVKKRKRDYRREYEQYHGKEGPKKDRAHRNAARRKLKERGLMERGLEAHHVDGNPRNNSMGNLRAVPKKYNRRKQI